MPRQRAIYGPPCGRINRRTFLEAFQKQIAHPAVSLQPLALEPG